VSAELAEPSRRSPSLPSSPGERPSPQELIAARHFLAGAHPRTPLRPSPQLSELTGCGLHIKCEDESPIRSFKGRGATWCVARLSASQRRAGVITASTGNHGQGIAYAATHAGVRSVVVVPPDTSSIKMERIRWFGAELRVEGSDLSEAALVARSIAESEGMCYVEDGEDGALMAGAATVGWEILEDLPSTEVIVVPVGGGNLIAGIALVAKRLNPAVEIVGVQSDAAPSVVRSFELGELVEMPCATSAGGLATRFAGALAFEVIRELVDDMILVSEEDLAAHIRESLRTRAVLIEAAAAAPFAALERHGASWRGRTVVLVQTGANLSLDELRAVIGAGDDKDDGVRWGMPAVEEKRS
jgi:threonine dehydratase